jgi:hypothetical protein
MKMSRLQTNANLTLRGQQVLKHHCLSRYTFPDYLSYSHALQTQYLFSDAFARERQSMVPTPVLTFAHFVPRTGYVAETNGRLRLLP